MARRVHPEKRKRHVFGDEALGRRKRVRQSLVVGISSVSVS